MLNYEDGRYQVTRPGEECAGPLALVPRQGDHLVCRASPRHSECGCRSGVKDPGWVSRVAAAPRGLQEDNPGAGAVSSGFVRDQAQQPTPSLYQLATRPLLNSSRRLLQQLDRLAGVCIPTLLPDWEVFAQVGGGGVHSATSGPCVANTGVVPPASGITERPPGPPTTVS